MKDRGWGFLGWARDPEHRRRVAILRTTAVFVGLPRRLLGRLAIRFFEKAYAGGDTVFREGDPGKALFVVVEGSVVISRAAADGEHVLRTLGPGACFGEMALIDDFPRSATARVTAPTRLLILYKSDFDALVDGEPRIALVTLRNLLHILAMYVRSAIPASPPPAVAEPAGVGDGGAPAGEAG
jgi:CRP/FNR family cyclic AMP-dependent transcriptional regulator